jgi:hypothetical protein
LSPFIFGSVCFVYVFRSSTRASPSILIAGVATELGEILEPESQQKVKNIAEATIRHRFNARWCLRVENTAQDWGFRISLLYPRSSLGKESQRAILGSNHQRKRSQKATRIETPAVFA